MILVGIDDTDTLDTPGTNQIARGMVSELPAGYRCHRIVRHQLFFDPRVPYTSKNGSCSIWLHHDVEPTAESLRELFESLKRSMLARFAVGSDPGLCLTPFFPGASPFPNKIVVHGQRCKTELMTQREARETAQRCGVRLEGLGGTEMGVIGALAALGLAATQDDGRVVQMGNSPDDLFGPQSVTTLFAAGVNSVRCLHTGAEITSGQIDVGKHLRPNLRGGNIVLFVEPQAADEWRAVKLV